MLRKQGRLFTPLKSERKGAAFDVTASRAPSSLTMGSVLPSSGQAQNGLTPEAKITKDGRGSRETRGQDSQVLGLCPEASPDVSLLDPEFGLHSTYWCRDHHKWLLNDF